MNKKQKGVLVITYLFVLMAAAISCDVEKDRDVLRTEVSFHAVAETVESRAVTAEDGSYVTDFVENDGIGIFVYPDGSEACKLNNVEAVYDGKSWKTAEAIMIKEDEKYGYFAYYPYKEGLDNPAAIVHEVASDQSVPSAYDLSDFMIASVAPTPETDVKLVFSHLLSYVEVSVEGEQTVEEVILKGVCRAINYDFISAEATSVDGSTGDVKMQKAADGRVFRAVIPAQEIDSGVELLRVRAGGKIYSFGSGENGVICENGKVVKLRVSPLKNLL